MMTTVLRALISQELYNRDVIGRAGAPIVAGAGIEPDAAGVVWWRPTLAGAEPAGFANPREHPTKIGREDIMATRRKVLHAAGAFGAWLTATRMPGPAYAAAPTVKTPVDFDVPRGACDCHVHIFDPAHFPYDVNRVYSPPEASIADLRDLQAALHFERVVIVTPSVYGIDNAVTLDAIRKLGPRARGVAVVDASTSAAALDDMAATGVRGVRLNLETAGESDPAAARRMLLSAAEQLRGRPWHVQFNTSLAVIAALKKDIEGLPFPVVIDHFGRAKASLGVNQPGLDAFLDLIKSGHAYVKISAPYRISEKAPDFPDARAIAQAMVAANPERVLWGSNWPHPGRGPSRLEIAPPHPSDDGMTLDQLPKWVPDPAVRKQILVDNPARLYGFA
jgi:predicted TIM-barrel fold metal-dependent hydrolase